MPLYQQRWMPVSSVRRLGEAVVAIVNAMSTDCRFFGKSMQERRLTLHQSPGRFGNFVIGKFGN